MKRTQPRIASGAIKAIAMSGPQRSASMPELATFTEQGKASGAKIE